MGMDHRAWDLGRDGRDLGRERKFPSDMIVGCEKSRLRAESAQHEHKGTQY